MPDWRRARLFIAAVVATSLVSRVFRSTELRVSGVVVDTTARRPAIHVG